MDGHNAVQRHAPRCGHLVRASAEVRALPAAHRSEPVAAEGVVIPRAPRTSNCPRFVRRQLAARLPELCEALVGQALQGDLQAAKLLWQMAELDRKPTGSGNRKAQTGMGLARKALAEFHAR